MAIKKSTKTIFIVLGILVIFLLVGYLILKSWILNQVSLAYSDCKSSVSQQIYKDMNSYKKDKEGNIADPNAISALSGAKEKLLQCVIDKTTDKFAFLGDEPKKIIKARLELQYGL